MIKIKSKNNDTIKQSSQIEKPTSQWLRLLLYAAVIILLNAAATSLFFRIDLTKNGIFSLSDLSKEVVATLEEPLTIKVFFSKNLPPPHVNKEQRLRDLLEEYALHANRFFNYTFYTMKEEADVPEEMAHDYSIYPVQIENVERDEIKLQSVYMGLVFIHGDMIETIPSLATTENLEYTITATIKKLNNRISALLGLEEDLEIKLYLSHSLYELGAGLSEMPGELKAVTDELNKQNYNRLRFEHINPEEEPHLEQELSKYRITPLALQTVRNGITEKMNAYASLVITAGEKSATINLINRGIFGYQVSDSGTLETQIEEAIERIIGINEEIGYVAGHGSPSLSRKPYGDNTAERVLSNLNTLVSENYTFRNISLSEEEIPEGISTLIIVGPKEKFSEFELFQIDQFLMEGNSVAVFLDTFLEYMPQQGQYGYGQQPVYMPIQTGLEDMLAHYGVSVRKSYVMDENCYVQRSRNMDGGISEVPVYFAPLISEENINSELKFIKDLKALVMLNISPLSLLREDDPDLESSVLFSSSSDSWEMSENINLYNPMMISPPGQGSRKSLPLSCLLEGKFRSYFEGKQRPARPAPDESPGEDSQEENVITSDLLSEKNEFLTDTDHGRLIVMGGSSSLGNNVLDSEGESTNSIFILNLLDYLNNQEDFAIMRGKGQIYNPLKESQPQTRTIIKTFNIAGLPILILIIGLFVWLRWLSKKRRIQTMFYTENRGGRTQEGSGSGGRA